MGFALAGVPHLSILVKDVGLIDVVGRGRPLRHHKSLKAGANVNFVVNRFTGPGRVGIQSMYLHMPSEE